MINLVRRSQWRWNEEAPPLRKRDRWADAVATYEVSFGKLCAGPVAPLLAAAHSPQPPSQPLDAVSHEGRW
jgi:hypothetical protein